MSFEFDKSSKIIFYYTMQFVHPRDRQDIFNRIYEALEWGGAFFLFEKVRASDARFQDIMVELYQEFKLDQGFDEVGILGKQRSLKGVLEPFAIQGNVDLLNRAGFQDILTVHEVRELRGLSRDQVIRQHRGRCSILNALT